MTIPEAIEQIKILTSKADEVKTGAGMVVLQEDINYLYRVLGYLVYQEETKEGK